MQGVPFVFITLCFTLFTINVYARSGCCSHHEGVCGCGCCDGTGLSATCAPYYPGCNSTYLAPKPAIPSCPANSSYNATSKNCVCYSGYTNSLDKSNCIKIPPNAHAIESLTEVWKCDYGYEEANNICQPKSRLSPASTQVSNTAPTEFNLSQKKETNTNSNQGSGGNTAVTFATLTALGGYIWYLNKRKPGEG